MKQSKLLDTERRGFPTSSQWADIYHLSALPCPVHLLERLPSFILELPFVWYEKTSSKAGPGISSPMCSGSQPFLTDKENVLCVRPWHSHNINSLSSRLLSTPFHCYCCISSPSTPKWQCWILTLTPSLARVSAEPNLQIRVSHLLPQSTLGCWTQSVRGVCLHNPDILCCQWAVFDEKNDLFICPIHKKILTKISYSSLC